MNQLATPPQITPIRRRHSEPPTLWLWVLAGSLLIHLATLFVLRVWLARSLPVRAMPAPIELVAIEVVPPSNPPSISSPDPAASADSSTTQPVATSSDDTIKTATASPAAASPDRLVATPAASSAPANVVPSPSPAPSPAPEVSPTARPTSMSPSTPPPSPPAPTPSPSPSPTPFPPPTPMPSASATPATSNEWLPPVPAALTPDPIAQTMDSELPVPPPLLGTGKGISMKVLAIRDGNQGSDVLDAIPPDQLPDEITDLDLEYQPEFRSEAARQTITLQVRVDQAGKLQEVVDVKHSPGEECSEYAKKLVQRISFPPPRQNRPAPQGYFEVDLKLEPI